MNNCVLLPSIQVPKSWLQKLQKEKFVELIYFLSAIWHSQKWPRKLGSLSTNTDIAFHFGNFL